ncbi:MULTISPECIES: peptide ABC transporter permease [Bacillati]|uniref:Peptide ABC transporter permease n=1 Tax=Staphylococcus epidermidis TaxID=1282 RepID=A0A894TKT9_STAEP|nr:MULTISPECIES: peptide ABC transporter permease [Bacteria]GHM75527.1 peptide ABC transporter permease [Bifidobacterium longum subsp. longum]HAA4268260.1 peptide ABC transporter permease [Listeria monocytogenes]MBF8103421.1 peptide ABC transporter permease [Staphylococcus epidermidis]MCG1344561.1 peptide ABC transporter permease [Staphylococcus epidermidis]MCG2488099.1 peptide ABC transporter permease [Staphylococcus epidermidis]
MKLEFKKSISNKILLTLGILFIFLFLLGYFLPVGIDKAKHLSYSQYFFSAYTVATEFGFLLFSFIIAYFINKEYSNKNTLFYKLIGENIFSFFYKKALVLFVECFIFIFLGITIISLVFSNFSHYLLLLILFSLVILQYILIVGTISLISPNVLVSIGISIIYWIGSIILVAINKNVFGVIAPFEASNSMYMSIEKILNNKMNMINSHDVWTIILFFFIIFIVNFIILISSKSRWLKLGM